MAQIQSGICGVSFFGADVRASMPIGVQKVRVEVRDTIDRILHYYPDGQILSEALQNAEKAMAGLA